MTYYFYLGHTNLDSLMSSLIITVEQHNLVIEREQIEEVGVVYIIGTA